MDRVIIGRNYRDQPAWKRYLGIPLIYAPLLTTIPFVIAGVLLVKFHLKYVGGMNIQPYWSFVPSWISHRYQYDNQITFDSKNTWFQFQGYRWYWIFNCKLYCPMSVALFRYITYLVKIVENWWCPFNHDKKNEYLEGAVDQSFWHIHQEGRQKLHPDDRENPLWNDEAGKNDL